MPKSIRYGVPGKGQGPVKWCQVCSRYHRRREPCDLYLRERVAKSGRRVQRWAH